MYHETVEEELNDYLQNDCYDTLNNPITLSEVKTALKSMKKNKSPGMDNFLLEYMDILMEIMGMDILKLLNNIFDSGCFPAIWSVGLIVPIHKKNSVDDTNNYRGITLLSSFGKLFTKILNTRLSSVADEFGLVSEAQFGFKSGCGTTDAIFILDRLIDYVLQGKEKLFCAFIDYQKAFDSVYRNGLWLKLVKLGIGGKFLTICRGMYNHVQSCVRHNNEISGAFTYNTGLRQGEILSPLLFSFFIEDLELKLQENITSGVDIHDLMLFLLLFADDMVLLSKSASGLQAQLNSLVNYCDVWGLSVNIDKTKVVVFQRSYILPRHMFYYDSVPLECLSEFNYLGMLFKANGNLTPGINLLADKGLKTCNALLKEIRQNKVDVKTALELFDACVVPVLHYGCEVWGWKQCECLERVHRKFCKNLLGVKNTTSNILVYGELGRFPLNVQRDLQMVKFWFKVVKSNNCILREIYSI